MDINTILVKSARRYFENSYFYRTYAIGRTLLALSLFLTFLFNGTAVLFAPTSIGEVVPYCQGNSISIFCILKGNLSLAKWISCFILFLVIIGWRPPVTGFLHWWVNFSYMTSTPMVDGGEHAATVLSLFLIPLTLLDHRQWHWQKINPAVHGGKPMGVKFVQVTFFELARLQVALIYLHAAVGKTKVIEWVDGTALWYWLSDPVYGLNRQLRTLVSPIVEDPFGVAFTTWGVLILELMLFVGFFLNKYQKWMLLCLGILFHVLIAVCLGLISFSIIMIGALFILLFENDGNKQHQLSSPTWSQ